MSGVRCIGRKLANLLCGVLAVCLLGGCGRLVYDMPYEPDSSVSSFNVVSRMDTRAAVPFAANLCVVTEDVEEEGLSLDLAEAAILCDVNRSQALYAKNAHEQLYPASLTKVMTALVALKYGSLDQTLTATASVNITESGAQLLRLKPGDTMTLDQALHILLIYSANDVAMMVAEGVGGSVENFVAMMNEEAKAIGATNTHFANPHGLTDEEHYTTAYDLYLIFNEAIKYETFLEIIHMNSYQTTYYDAQGKPKEVDKTTTNLFLRTDSQFKAPAGVTVIGGKTGTTQAAGHCLMLLARDVGGAPYIAVVLRAENGDNLYGEMIRLLEAIP